MTSSEIYKEIKNVCLDIILNTTTDDWLYANRKDENQFEIIKNNIKIKIGLYYYFMVSIYTNDLSEIKSKITFEKKFMFIAGWLKRSKVEYQNQKKLNAKIFEISNFLSELSSYKDATEVYNLLPIKELRKKKLNIINNES